NPAVRILVSTGAMVGGGVEGKLEELKSMGINTVLLKPYSNTTLLREVHKALHPPASSNPA
ncbi:MAG: hypothetical protein HZA89_09515, partial [Verrucomicrobia bacterium]|nr:hypothetical protein [Verrucomicrobiota bacterium]